MHLVGFPKLKTEGEVKAYKQKWSGQLKGPLTLTVDKAQFAQALAAQETRQGQRYDAFARNSNYAVRWVINQSITYGIGAASKGGLGYAPGFGDPTK